MICPKKDDFKIPSPMLSSKKEMRFQVRNACTGSDCEGGDEAARDAYTQGLSVEAYSLDELIDFNKYGDGKPTIWRINRFLAPKFLQTNYIQ